MVFRDYLLFFQFVGVFKDEDDNQLPPLTLQKTDYLPSFAGMQWNCENSELSFTKEQQLFSSVLGWILLL